MILMRKRKAERYPRIRNNQAFKQRVYELVGDEYTFLDSYRGSSIKIRCRHNTCGNVWLITPNNFLRGNRCPREKVARIAKHETTKNCEFIERVQLLVGNDYIFLEPYKNAHTKIAYFHKDCAHVHYMNPNNFLNGQRCPECYKYMANTRKWVAKRNLFFKKLKNKYRCLTTYISYEKPVTLLHLKCFKKMENYAKTFC